MNVRLSAHATITATTRDAFQLNNAEGDVEPNRPGVGQYRVALLRYRLEVSQYALNAQARREWLLADRQVGAEATPLRVSPHVVEIAFDERVLFAVVTLNQAEIKEQSLKEHLRRDALGIEELTDFRIEVDRQALAGRLVGPPGHGARPR